MVATPLDTNRKRSALRELRAVSRSGAALAEKFDAGDVAVFEALPALEAADRLGRPIAILRMGSRVPMPDEDQGRFLFQQPPALLLEQPMHVARNSGLEPPLEAPPQIGRA